jgi:hypothetical protein
MKNRILICLSFIFIVSVSYGQDVVSTRDRYPEMKYLDLSGTIYHNSYFQVKGSAYLSDEWTHGTIFLTDGTTLKNISFKIDLYTQQILVYHDILKRVITIDNHKFGYLVFNENSKLRKFKLVDGLKTQSAAKEGVVVEALSEGKIGFYKVYYKNKNPLLEPSLPFIYEFMDVSRYFILKGSSYFPVKCRKHNLIRLFPEYKANIKQHIRQSHLKLKKESDFSKAVDYINELEK